MNTVKDILHGVYIKEVSGRFGIHGNAKFESLEGCPEKVGDMFIIDSCSNLKSFNGFPKYVTSDALIRNCKNVTDISGLKGVRINGYFEMIINYKLGQSILGDKYNFKELATVREMHAQEKELDKAAYEIVKYIRSLAKIGEDIALGLLRFEGDQLPRWTTT
jgi:hypothetical protein